MTTSKYMILGGGMVAGYAAKELAERGLKPDELTIISSDDALPYERPPLSKSFLAGKDQESDVLIEKDAFYREHKINVQLNTRITRVDWDKRQLISESGDDFAFEKLIIATGAKVKELSVPGSDLKGVFYLRSLDDSKKIREASTAAKRAVVIGSGFIAMETASVLASRKIATTMIVREDRIWKSFFTPEMSSFFENYYHEHGVTILKQTTVTGIEGNAAVRSVKLSNGATLDCDMILAGVGVSPVTELFQGSPLKVSNGIEVNEYLETNVDGVLAAGDVANYPDQIFGKRRRVEHWDNAVSQGKHCAHLLTGDRTPFVHVPYFFSDDFDLSYEYWGDSEGATDIVPRGDWKTNSFSVWWLKDNRLIAAFTLNRPDEEREAAPKWIESKEEVSKERLKREKLA